MAQFIYKTLDSWKDFVSAPTKEKYKQAQEELKRLFERAEYDMDLEAEKLLPSPEDSEDDSFYQNQMADPDMYQQMISESEEDGDDRDERQVPELTAGGQSESDSDATEGEEDGDDRDFQQALRFFKDNPSYRTYRSALSVIDKLYELEEGQEAGADEMFDLNEVAKDLPNARDIFMLPEDLDSLDLTVPLEENARGVKRRSSLNTRASDVQDWTVNNTYKRKRIAGESRQAGNSVALDSESDSDGYLS